MTVEGQQLQARLDAVQALLDEIEAVGIREWLGAPTREDRNHG